MLDSLRRLPLLAAVLALSLVAGPAASALCAHLADGHMMSMMMDGEMAMDTSEAPCHDAPMPESPPAEEQGADCESPCCVAAPQPIPLTASTSLPVLAEAPETIVEAVWSTEASVEVYAKRGLPPPPRLYLETGRVRV